MRDGGMVEALARRDRAVVAGGLAAIVALSWLYLFVVAAVTEQTMDGMNATSMAALRPWVMADVVFSFAMWAVMMAAMMLPSASPMILLYAAIARKRLAAGRPVAATGLFAAGYLTVWTVFSAFATALQWGLGRAALLSPMMVATSSYLGGALLIAAGVYQLTPLKHVCLRHCRSPISFISSHWRETAGGAFRMGLDHGLVCLGCCWAIMGLLFVGGVMNLIWVAGITVFVLLEKLASRGVLVARGGGGLLVLAGFWLMAQD